MGRKVWKNNLLEILSQKSDWLPIGNVKMADKNLMGTEYRYWNKNKKEYSPFDLFKLRYTEWYQNRDNDKCKREVIDKKH